MGRLAAAWRWATSKDRWWVWLVLGIAALVMMLLRSRQRVAALEGSLDSASTRAGAAEDHLAEDQAARLESDRLHEEAAVEEREAAAEIAEDVADLDDAADDDQDAFAEHLEELAGR
jgi:hypothetical protein